MSREDLIERLSTLAGSSHDPTAGERVRRLIATPSNRWRIEWIAELFPGLTEADKSALRAAIEAVQPQRPHFAPERLKALRERLAALSLDGFIVPQADEHQGEYIPARNHRLAWLTGFTGSAGTAVVARERAWLFVDGRYVEQAKGEVDASFIEPRHFKKPPIWQFLIGTLEPGARLGYDPALHAVSEIEQIGKELAGARIELIGVARNPIDELWSERPAAAFSPVVPRPVELSGKSAADKLGEIAAALQKEKADAVVLNQLDAIAWLYNIRGGDVTFTPVVDAYAVVFADARSELLVERQKLRPAAARELGNSVLVRDVAEFGDGLATLGKRALTVGADPARTTVWMQNAITQTGGTIKPMQDPTTLPRARKNPVEIEKIKEAMARDAVCMTRFLHWFHTRPDDGLPDELEVVDAIERFRADDPTYLGPSFPSIVGIGGNGAIVHYHPAPESNRRARADDLVLVDCGGQFLSGTTDITRTLVHGAPDAKRKRIYTAVLKGHIALACARFPAGTVGAQLDALARAAVWQAGVNYDHGTGHGIGAFLGVHEGPVRIAPGGNLPLEASMLFSNEPGAYLPGEFGIRLENAVLVVAAGQGETGEDFLCFETLSLAPFDRALIEADMLSTEERRWLDAYHARVRAEVAPRVSAKEAAWLAEATRPI
jgi:Xaa-Pro aminopeptidase